MVATAEKILNRKPGGFASRRSPGALRALAVQEPGQPEKGVYLGRAEMDRFSTAVTRPPLSSAATVAFYNELRSTNNDQKIDFDDLFIDHDSLAVEPSGNQTADGSQYAWNILY